MKLTRASHELFRRSPDETFPSLSLLSQHCQWQKEQTQEIWQPPKTLGARAVNMDRLLHRGQYRREDSGQVVYPGRIPKWQRTLLGIDEQYTRGDKAIAWSVFAWSMLGFALFLIAAGWNLVGYRWSSKAWFEWWKWNSVLVAAIVGAVTTVWFTWGGLRDLRALFRNGGGFGGIGGFCVFHGGVCPFGG